jgi:isoleucyl-tRNA synthetase
MGDWMISKKRFWGLALPIWVDEQTGDFEVIGSREELKARAVEGWEEFEGRTPHRPWVDKVKIRNPKTGNLMSRVPDVGNPWLDAGIVPFSTLHYRKDRAYWEKWFPADFITESFPGQFRNWFYAILAMSTMMVDRAPFKVLLGHGLVLDERGETMSKSKGNAIAFDEAADKMGADVCRWMYCRSNPAAHILFGYGAANEVRAKFILKLWNTYAFFCNYARLDGFDASAPQVPISERSDLDRWILSDLQLLVRTARQSFESYNVMAFCLEAERFVDDKLSNWYVRRSRRRFWKGEQGADKLAAYQTLYTVLTTLAKLIAPVIPFLAETMYQNLRTAADPESVHLCDYPEADARLIDEDLSADMEALLRLVTLGSAARNVAKIKVRQPLAELKVKASSDAERDAVRRFSDQIAEELNVKKVAICENPWQLCRRDYHLVESRIKFDFGAKAGMVIAALKRLPKELTSQLGGQEEPYVLVLPSGERETLNQPHSYYEIMVSGVEGWAAVNDSSTFVGVDIRITDSLKLEGMAREVVRHVQDSRKGANLEMEDRIELHLATESAKLQQAIEAHRGYIAGETLATRWAEGPLNGEAYQAKVSVDGQPLTIQLRKLAAWA